MISLPQSYGGSSEHSGFSVVIYGDVIPEEMDDINIVTLEQTTDVHQRVKEEEMIVKLLESTFDTIEDAAKIKLDYPQHRSVKLLDAFKTAHDQRKSPHAHKKREFFCAEQ